MMQTEPGRGGTRTRYPSGRARNYSMLSSKLLLAFLCTAALHAEQWYLFTYFKDPGSSGVYFALSNDGYHFTPINEGNPVVWPAQKGELMRDAFLTRGPDKL